MTFDAHKNFAYSTLGSVPAPATTGTTLVTTGGTWPATPFNAILWPLNVQPSPLNAEVVRVGTVSGGTFTIVRAQEGSTAGTFSVGDQVGANLTAKALTDIEAALATEIGYDELTSNVAIATNTSPGTTVISCAAHTFDGNPVMFEFFCAAGDAGGTGNALAITLCEGGTQIGRVYQNSSLLSGAYDAGIVGRLRFTPTAGSHTYTIKAIGAGNTLYAQSPGTDQIVSMFARFTKAA